MKNITFIVNKVAVYDEVAKTTSYVGAKMLGDESAYRRIFTTDADQLMLERFWNETCSAVTEHLKRFVVEVSNHTNPNAVDLTSNYSISLEVSSAFDDRFKDSMDASLFSLFVASIVSKWFKFTNRDEAEAYTLEATSHMEDVLRKIYHRKKARRTILDRFEHLSVNKEEVVLTINTDEVWVKKEE
jgi:hypothetical protein